MGDRNEIAGSWRRGIMHAVECIDQLVNPAEPISKRRAPEVLAAVRAELDALQRFTYEVEPNSYDVAFRLSEARLHLLISRLRSTPKDKSGADQARE